MSPAARSLSLTVPAKINLFLEIVNRRPDGYHTLSSLFQEISLADELRVTRKNRRGPQSPLCRLTVAGQKLSAGPDNLVARAAHAYGEKRFPKDWSLQVYLRKRIPAGAGLGGGSSDAAAMLKACWALHKGRSWRSFPAAPYGPLARSLGADVPFFLRGGLAEAGGVGERLSPLKGPPQKVTYWFVLVFPRVFVSTEKVFKRLRFPLTKRRSNRKLKRLLSQGVPAEKWAPFVFNRLEDVVLPRVKPVAQAKKALIQTGCCAALMSGSGSSVFGVVRSESEGRRVMQQLRSKPWDLWLVKSN